MGFVNKKPQHKFRVLILGGYGNFGGFVSRTLARDANMTVIIGGRSLEKAKKFVAKYNIEQACELACFDLHVDLRQTLERLKPDLVIHTSGPFQGQSYHVAQACIAHPCHYVDLADGRDYVSGISQLDAQAKQAGVLICSGASTVPALSSAIIDHFKPRFVRLEKVDYAIATAHLTNRGLATLRAVLSYAGKPFMTLIDGEMRPVYGWLDLRFRKFWGLGKESLGKEGLGKEGLGTKNVGKKALGNCDIPDLELFPIRYPDLKTVRFQAGLELIPLHVILSMMSTLVKWRLFPNLSRFSKIFLRISYLFDRFGTDDSGFYMTLSGQGKSGELLSVNFEMVARRGDGLIIPTIGMIVMAQKLAAGEINETGAKPCMGMIDLEEYLEPLGSYDIQWTNINSEL